MANRFLPSNQNNSPVSTGNIEATEMETPSIVLPAATASSADERGEEPQSATHRSITSAQSDRDVPAHLYPSIPTDYFNTDLAPFDAEDVLPYAAPSASDKSAVQEFTISSIPGLNGWAEANKTTKNRARYIRALFLGKEFRAAPVPDTSTISAQTSIIPRNYQIKPMIRHNIDLLEALLLSVWVMHNKRGNIMVLAPKAKCVASLTQQLREIKEIYREDLLVTPTLPIWGASHNYQMWRSLNDFEIIVTKLPL